MRSIVVLLTLAVAGTAAEIRGRVVDAATREALARVSVRGCGADSIRTDAQGRFQLDAPEAECALQVAGVGYRPFTVQIDASQPRDVEVLLHPDTLRRSESVDVVAAPFAGEEGAAVGLAGNELRNLASVLSDDPFRAVQALPGVTSNDDFQSQFAVRGAGFQRIGVYLDGVLLHSPFHALQGDQTGASISPSASVSIVEGELLQGATLYPSALPPMYGDRSAGALDFRTRDGDRRRFGARAAASASNAGLTAEGPLGKRGSWLAAARKSYLQYIIKRTSDDPTLGFSFWDGQGKVAYQLGSQHWLTLSMIDGHSGLDRTSGARQFGLNSIVQSAYHFSLGSLAWRWSPHERLVVTNRASWMRERSEILNRDRLPILGSGYGESLWNADGSWTIAPNAVLDFGGGVRRIRDDGFYNRLLNPPAPPSPIERFRGAGVRSGGYVQQSLSAGTRLQLVFGGRADYSDIDNVTAWSPYAAASVGLWRQGRLHLNWGQSAQYPEIGQFFGIPGSRALPPERATHLQAAFEQGIDSRTRIRAEVYQRQDRDLLFRPTADPRVVDGRVVIPPPYPEWANSLRGRARGFQVFLQRRAANNVTGWVAYAYGKSLVRDGVTGGEFPSDYDQTHSVRAFASYRMRPTVNLSARWTWGSGLPIPGYFERGQFDYFLSTQRNRLRLPDYRRADFRINKAFPRKWGQMTLFAEVINLTNRENVRFDGLDGYDPVTRRARPGIETMFPILPSAGVVIDF